jgi:hypothetical protein
MKNTIYIGTLDRFGYELRVASHSEEETRKALLKDYRRAYKNRNGFYPDKETISTVNDDMNIDEFKLNEVHWI